MTENKRFTMEESEGQDTIYDNEGIDDYYHLGNDTRDVKAVCDLLNEQDGEIKKLQKIGQEIFEWDSKRCIHILEAMQKFARQYSQDSIEFNLLYELGKELPINPNNLWPKEAFEDEGAEE